ncbi:MAG: hypothetical protein RR853_09205 [Aurantimicrobium sp.]
MTAIVDSLDADQDPDLVPLAGKVSFTLNAARVVDNSGATPVILAPTTIVAVLDAEGYLSTPDASGGVQYQGVRLPANNDPNQNPTETQWQVTYDLQVPGTGKVAALPTHQLYLPSNSVVNLGAIIPPDPQQPMSISQAEALLALAVRTVNGLAPDAEGNVVVAGGGPGGPIAITDVTGLEAELLGKATHTELNALVDEFDAYAETTDLEIATKATQSSVNALSAGLATTNENLGGVFNLAQGANTAAEAAQATANEAKGKADTAVQPTNPLMIKGILEPGQLPTGATGFYIQRVS